MVVPPLTKLSVCVKCKGIRCLHGWSQSFTDVNQWIHVNKAALSLLALAVLSLSNFCDTALIVNVLSESFHFQPQITNVATLPIENIQRFNLRQLQHSHNLRNLKQGIMGMIPVVIVVRFNGTTRLLSVGLPKAFNGASQMIDSKKVVSAVNGGKRIDEKDARKYLFF